MLFFPGWRVSKHKNVKNEHNSVGVHFYPYFLNEDAPFVIAKIKL